MVRLIRRGCTCTEIARTLGRTCGALEAAADRLISPARRPARRSESWSRLCGDLTSSNPDTDPDWLARYTDGLNTPRVPRETHELRPKPAGPVDVPPASAFTVPQMLRLDAASAIDCWCHLVAAAAGELVDDRERYILLSRLGLLDEHSNTLRAIGDALAISGERVRQLEQRALARIERRASRPGSVASELADAVEVLADGSDDALVARLVDGAETEFCCQPVWMVAAVSQMVGASSTRVEQLSALAGEYLSFRRDEAREHARKQQRQATIERCVDKWIRDAVWPASTGTLSDVAVYCQRMPDSHNRIGLSGSFYSDKLNRTVS